MTEFSHMSTQDLRRTEAAIQAMLASERYRANPDTLLDLQESLVEVQTELTWREHDAESAPA